MLPTLYTIERAGPGRISVMARPRGGDWLKDEFRSLSLAGVDVVVSALTTEEQDELVLSQEADAAQLAGLTYLAAPIPDRTVPELPVIEPVLDEAAAIVSNGGHVAIHCRAGIGRSSLLVAAILVREGLSPEDAWSRIAEARGLPVPDTDEQRAWVAQLIPLQ